jgi:hypothetical protein
MSILVLLTQTVVTSLMFWVAEYLSLMYEQILDWTNNTQFILRDEPIRKINNMMLKFRYHGFYIILVFTCWLSFANVRALTL